MTNNRASDKILNFSRERIHRPIKASNIDMTIRQCRRTPHFPRDIPPSGASTMCIEGIKIAISRADIDETSSYNRRRQHLRTRRIPPHQAAFHGVNTQNRAAIVPNIEPSITQCHTTAHSIYQRLTVSCIKRVIPAQSTVGTIESKNSTMPCRDIDSVSFRQRCTGNSIIGIKRPADMAVSQVQCPELCPRSQADVNCIPQQSWRPARWPRTHTTMKFPCKLPIRCFKRPYCGTRCKQYTLTRYHRRSLYLLMCFKRPVNLPGISVQSLYRAAMHRHKNHLPL